MEVGIGSLTEGQGLIDKQMLFCGIRVRVVMLVLGSLLQLPIYIYISLHITLQFRYFSIQFTDLLLGTCIFLFQFPEILQKLLNS